MTEPVADRKAMIAGMAPVLDPQRYRFVTASDPAQAIDLMRSALATFREEEGLSLIVPADAVRGAEADALVFARIVLQVHSSLEGVGLTAAVASALADAGIACNCVAAVHHDHIFVPDADAKKALDILQRLQEEHR